MILAAAMMVFLITIFWGLLGSAWKSYIVISVMAWGFGDTAAALVGISFGRHPIKHHLADGNKTLEGSLAMYFASLLVIFATTLLFFSVPWYLCLVLALLAALVAAGVELISRNGIDTVTIPCSVAISLYVLSKLLSFLV